MKKSDWKRQWIEDQIKFDNVHAFLNGVIKDCQEKLAQEKEETLKLRTMCENLLNEREQFLNEREQLFNERAADPAPPALPPEPAVGSIVLANGVSWVVLSHSYGDLRVMDPDADRYGLLSDIMVAPDYRVLYDGNES